MSERIVSDTGPLISLEKLTGGFPFIRELYDVVLVPPAVLRELTQGPFEGAQAYLDHYDITGLIEVKEFASPEMHAEMAHLEEGERQAIQLALEERLPLLIEEEAGRKTARTLDVQISGIAGQLGKGFRRGVLNREEAKGKLDELLRAGRINIGVHDTVAQAIEERA